MDTQPVLAQVGEVSRAPGGPWPRCCPPRATTRFSRHDGARPCPSCAHSPGSRALVLHGPGDPVVSSLDNTGPVTGGMTFLLVVAGIGAGLAGSIAGLASVVSYPALLAAGLAPLAANVTNTVALTLSATGSVLGSRPELVGQGPRVRRLTAAAIAGGATGAAILLVTPAERL